MSPTLDDATRDYSQELPVFPGAEGFGTATKAGRGGKVIHVTSLEPEGPGTLREALLDPEPRTIVFDVAGIIDCRRMLSIPHPYVTVAGESAPPPGVTVIGAGLVVSTHDVLVRHLRFRVGDREDGPNPGGRDGIGVVGVADGSRDVFNVVIDHCSVAWAVDEGMSTWHRGVRDVTYRQCIVAENLSESIHPKGEHSKGMLLGDHGRRISVIGNLMAHNMRRSPYVKGDVSALIANNVVYNPGRAAIHVGDYEGIGPPLAVILANWYKPGPSTAKDVPAILLQWDLPSTARVYGWGNVSHGAPLRGGLGKEVWRDIASPEAAPVYVRPLTLRSGDAVLDWVLENAGAWPGYRDETDLRIVQSVRDGGGAIIDSQDDVGGFPKGTPVHRVADTPPRPAEDDDGDGYTNLEEWLHARADAACGIE